MVLGFILDVIRQRKMKKGKKFRCAECGASFPDERELQIHTGRGHGGKGAP